MAKKSPAKKTGLKKAVASKIKPAKKAVKKASKKSANKLSNATPFVGHSTKLKEGNLAPAFEGIDQNGNVVSLALLKGKTIVLYFYPKDNTPGCTATACSLRDEYRYLSKNNYAVIGVSADSEKSHKKFAQKYELPFPLLADEDLKIIKAYDVWGLKQLFGKIYDGIVRTTFIIDEKGIIKNVIKSVDTENHAQQILTQ
jgi:peroxiredoxin Q/BCP